VLSTNKKDSAIYLAIKRMLDVFIAAAGLILLSPLFIYVAVRVRLSSSGPIFYAQERVGFNGRKFIMLKFRSMYTNAENGVPQLSADNDARVTCWGRIMRKWKLDELPQLWNVLKGEMSIVGPRPEREYYIRQIEQRQNSYEYLLQVKPGITSMGMIRYGYAGNVDEMAARMKYDYEYLSKRSLGLDLKIMIGTLRLILMARGQ
jgi:lipopolysaccharide/colanic/teichoic acid biosynthesis glycosyltransferase